MANQKMPWHHVAAVSAPDGKNITYAVIELYSSKRSRMAGVLNDIKNACARWAAVSDTGMAELKRTNGNFNIADLAANKQDFELRKCLSDYGIGIIRIELVKTPTLSTVWQYNDKLMEQKCRRPPRRNTPT